MAGCRCHRGRGHYLTACCRSLWCSSCWTSVTGPCCPSWCLRCRWWSLQLNWIALPLIFLARYVGAESWPSLSLVGLGWSIWRVLLLVAYYVVQLGGQYPARVNGLGGLFVFKPIGLFLASFRASSRCVASRSGPYLFLSFKVIRFQVLRSLLI